MMFVLDKEGCADRTEISSLMKVVSEVSGALRSVSEWINALCRPRASPSLTSSQSTFCHGKLAISSGVGRGDGLKIVVISLEWFRA